MHKIGACVLYNEDDKKISQFTVVLMQIPVAVCEITPDSFDRMTKAAGERPNIIILGEDTVNERIKQVSKYDRIVVRTKNRLGWLNLSHLPVLYRRQ